MYNFIIRLFVLAIRIVAFFSPKARLWIQGRNDWREQLKSKINDQWSKVNGQRSMVLWLHAASLGEFEQGRPIMEAFRVQFPDWKIVLTFFSPSGYEVRKDYSQADLVCYLPADTHRNARDFLDLIQPDAVIFVKYEFWANYLFELKKRGVPTLLVSALFRPSQPFFKWYGNFWRSMLECFTQIFVQNESSGKLLQSIGNQNITVAGDTRVDRVIKIAEGAKENKIVAAFRKSPIDDGLCNLLIAGSTWPQDESLLAEGLRLSLVDDVKIVFAPHNPSPKSVSHILTLLPHVEFGTTLLYSQAKPEIAAQASTLIIDNIGLLNTLYRYGTIAYIGGGFGKDIHNTLEPAAFGLPIIFGPKYEKFEEARQFVAGGGAFPVRNAAELAAILGKLQDPVFYKNASDAVRAYLEENRGATGKVMKFLEKEFG